ncbi:twin-arginine translocase TatA/TatE family subunit [Streptomyces flaveolus]|uniref:twin-arginine translocase TatA/TatE family subunit n=1 Tax=Streptomyces flaveolus TaxID=67297 RepID=UPI0033F11A14
MFGLSELAIILVVVIAVLAAKKLPGLARSAGKSARILKAEARAAKDEQAPAEVPGTPRVIPGETVRREDT